LRRFREGNTPSEDKTEPEDRSQSWDVLSKFLSEYPFASAKNIASHFDTGVSIVKDLLARSLELRKSTRRWAPDSLSERQKNKRVAQSRSLLDLLQRC
jgi:hypothetical protein